MNLIRRRTVWLLLVLACGLISNVVRAEDGEGAGEGGAPDQVADKEAEEAPPVQDSPSEVATSESESAAAPVADAPVPDEAVPEATTAAPNVDAPASDAGAAVPDVGNVPSQDTTVAPETTQEVTTGTTTPTTTPVPFTARTLPYNDKEMKDGVVTIKLSKKLSPSQRQELITAIRKRLNENANARAAKARKRTTTAAPVTTQSADTREDIAAADSGARTDAPVDPALESTAVPVVEDVPPKLEASFLRRRRNTEGSFTKNDIVLVDHTDKDTDIVPIAVQNNHGEYISAEELAEILEEIKPDVEAEMEKNPETKGIKIEKITPGIEPQNLESGDGVWDVHYGILITLIVIISVCLFVVLFCCFCIRCCARQPVSSEKTPMAMEEARPIKKTPIVMSSPFTDEEMVKGETPIVAVSAGPSLQSATPAAPNNQSTPRGSMRDKKKQSTPKGSMREKDDPSKTRNGGGQHISKPDEEYEYGIVPLEQLSKSERNQEDVENTKF